MGQVAQPSKSAARLRYRFDSTDQLKRHFHQQEGRMMLFFPGGALAEGQPVVLDVSFTNSDQSCALRGRALGNEQGRVPGIWLDFSLAGLVAGLAEASRSHRRRHRRLPCDLMLTLLLPGGPELSRMTDLSLGGARLVGFNARVAPGTEVRLTPFGQVAQTPLDTGRVCWARPGDLGLRFQRADGQARAAVARLVESVQVEWRDAQEAAHPSLCACENGGPAFEPALPRAGFRRSVDPERER